MAEVEQSLRIGDLVRIKAKLKFEYENKMSYLPPGVTIVYAPDKIQYRYRKILYRYPINEERGVVIGWSVKRTGNLIPSYSDDGQSALISEVGDYFKIWMIEPLSPDQRYHKPYDCLESDLEKIGGY